MENTETRASKEARSQSPRRRSSSWLITLAIAALTAFALLAAGFEGAVVAQTSTSGWLPKEPPLKTPWTDKVSPDNALPKYPRPQMTRERWQNLNGVWQFAGASADEAPPVGQNLSERILVPYPVESALSGIKRYEDRMWYRRTFTVPDTWQVSNGQRLLLHFEAVDYQTTVWVNGKLVGTHEGGYDSFTFDVTDALKPSGEQEIVVGVYDPTDRGGQPIGKQRINPGSIFYTSTSGIWQTVWMEPVSSAHVERLDMTPDLENATLRITARAANAQGKTVVATAYDGRGKVGTVTGPANQELRLPVPNPKLWSPDNPFLYQLKVRLLDGERTVDSVNSYFGMRSVGLKKVNGELVVVLNGRFTFQMGTLDQGYWPDGIYTAPTDDALRFDLEQQKRLGYNTVRKHVKVEPDRWFYWADKLGLIVWQDMPAMFPPGGEPTTADRQEFEKELREMVDEHRSHPSVAMWVPFNEGWGQYDGARIADMVKSWDPSRLVNGASGWFDTGNGDVIDLHIYPGPGSPEPTDERAAVLGEFGGLGLRVEGHEWSPGNGFAYEMEPNAEVLTDRYVELNQQTQYLVKRCSLSAAIYTQPTDVENEINGLYTYDRQVLKPDAARVKNANEAVILASDQVGSVQPPAPPPGTPGLTGVGYWPLDEGSGTVAHDSADGYDATLVNGPTWTDGHTGKALHFDGQDDYADTGTNILDTTGNYSVAAWVQLDDLNGFQTAVSQDGISASAFFLQYSDADDRLAFSFSGVRALAPTPPQTGQWYHLVGVRDVVSDQLKLYVDGQLAGTTSACPGEASQGHTVIGRAKYAGNQVDFWHGKIDQVHVYDRALSDAEVSELYESGK